LENVNEVMSWKEIDKIIHDLACKLKTTGFNFTEVVGIENGGIVPARLIARDLDIDDIRFIRMKAGKITESYNFQLEDKRKYLIIDDILDTGDTYKHISNYLVGYDCTYAFCVARNYWPKVYTGKVLSHKKWVVFPW
jgi:hypoxanthine phosphoribosyltransferase